MKSKQRVLENNSSSFASFNETALSNQMVYSLRRKNRSHKKKRNKLEGVNVVGDIETIKEENTTVEYQS
jgi:hypothetical protein